MRMRRGAPMKFKCVNYLYYAYVESINYGAGLGDVDLTKRIILHTNNVNSTYIHIYKETVEEEKKKKRRDDEEEEDSYRDRVL